MLIKNTSILSILAALVFGLSLTTGQVLAKQELAGEHQTEFTKIEQPLGLKIGVILGGLGLISAELWWFMFSKTQSKTAQIKQGLQEIDIVVNGGYIPDRIEVRAGEAVKLNFLRQDANSCLEQVLLPDFHKTLNLPLNQTISVEIMPEKPGEYTFSCGMNMYRGVIKAN